MRCDDAQVAVSARADGELDGDAAHADLDAHLAGCAACRGFAQEVQRIRSGLRVEAVARVPDVGPAVVARLRAGAASGRDARGADASLPTGAAATDPGADRGLASVAAASRTLGPGPGAAPADRTDGEASTGTDTAAQPSTGTTTGADPGPAGRGRRWPAGPRAQRARAGQRAARGRPAGAGRRGGEPERAGRRVAVAAAIALVAGIAAGATFVGVGTRPRSPAAADLPTLVMAGQAGVSSLDVRLRIVEATPGGSPRELDADLAYRAPESLALRVYEAGDAGAEARDAGGEPMGELVVDGDRWWQRRTRACSPADGLVRCPDEPVVWTRAVAGREPFSAATPVPLDLVSPVSSFALADTVDELGAATVAGRDAVGVAVTAAQVAPLLDGLATVVDLQPVHPTDPVELWLDADHGVPLDLVVRAADGPDRRRWADAVGAAGTAGDVILTVTAGSAAINGAVADDALAPPAGARAMPVSDAGFSAVEDGGDALAAAPVPATLPDGFTPHRAGIVASAGGPTVAVRSWSDGRAWLTVRATTEWDGTRLFGDVGRDVRPVDLGAAGVAYASSDGRRLGLHTADRDIVVAGSLPADRIEAVAADLGVVGLAVPAAWDEAATSNLDEAAQALPGLLTAPALDGFGPASVRVDGATVTQAHAGGGGRALTLTQQADRTLAPPSAGDEAAVTVRGTDGRYSLLRGEIEWVEGGVAVSLRSDTLALDELVGIADALVPAEEAGSG